MRRHTESGQTNPNESTALPNSARRAIARLLGTGRERPESVEADAKLHAAHVRPAPFRPGLY